MVLADSSIWIDFIRKPDRDFMLALEAGEVASHSFVAGELSLGHFRNRNRFMDEFLRLPRVDEATHREVIHLVESRKLYGTGLAWVDCHLLCSALLGGHPLHTHDKPLARAAKKLKINWK